MNRDSIKAWAQLLRLPNVFTALADVIAGALLALGRWPEGDEVLTLIRVCFASACLYSAGMVLNDFFDVEEDARDRPFRPIPSGRVKRNAAGYVGFGLLLIGFIFGCPWDWSENWQERLYPLARIVSCLISFALAGMILLYNAWLKRTWFGPLAMGSCRFLNLLLGAANALWIPKYVCYAALFVGMYISLVSFIAKYETNQNRPFVFGGLQVRQYWLILLAIGVFAPSIAGICAELLERATILIPHGYHRILALLLFFCWAIALDWFLLQALIKPEPKQIQTAVKACIFGLIGLDSILPFLDVPSSLFILLLLIPSIILGRFIYST
jgi:4-hydroxybenzoate polyprenyltransferase